MIGCLYARFMHRPPCGWSDWRNSSKSGVYGSHLECRACDRKGHWANDRQCAMSSFSSSTQNQTRTVRMATRRHLTNRANQAGVCFVLNEYCDDPDTSAFWLVKTYFCRQKRPNRFPQSTSRTQPLSTIAPWPTTTNRGRPKPITGQDGTTRSRTERIVACCMVLIAR